jgi:hypothetical protein
MHVMSVIAVLTFLLFLFVRFERAVVPPASPRLFSNISILKCRGITVLVDDLPQNPQQISAKWAET